MKNKVIVVAADSTCANIEETINAELEKGWLIELFYEARDSERNKIIVTLYKEDNVNGDK